MGDLFRYASELEHLGQPDRALAEYADLADACLEGIEPLVRRADLLRRLGRVVEAEADLRRALLWPASALEDLGQTDRALAEYAKLADARLGGVDPLLRRADLLGRLGRVPEAEADLRDAAATSNDDGRPLLRLAQLAADTGRPWMSARYIDRAVAREPEVPEFRIAAAAIFLSLDWFDRAFAVLRRLPVNLSAEQEIVRTRAREAYDVHLADARARLRQYGEQFDGILDAWELALALFKVGRLEAASRLCEQVMRDRPHSFAAFEFYAKIIARQRAAAAAVEFLRAIRFLHGDDPDHARMLDLMVRQVEP